MTLFKKLVILCFLINTCSISWALEEQQVQLLKPNTGIAFNSAELLNSLDKKAVIWDF